MNATSDNSAADRALDQLLELGLPVERNAALGPFTTYKVGGPASLLVRPDSVEQLEAICSLRLGQDMDILVVGRGSNLLVADAGFDGLAIHLGAGFAAISTEGTTVEAGAAATLPVVARRTVKEGLTGFEWAVGVPGSVGGAVRMNAGGHGSDISRSLTSIRVADLSSGETRTVAATDLGLAYRHSDLKRRELVVSAQLDLDYGDSAAGESELSSIVSWRRENQPGGSNAGSVFANPVPSSQSAPLHSGQLIDDAGCKGLRIGTAEVSMKHANFIQSDQGGSADDVFAVMVEVASRVRKHSGVTLKPETHMIGFSDFAQALR